MQRSHVRVHPRPRNCGVLDHVVHVHQVVALVVAPQGVVTVNVTIFGLSGKMLGTVKALKNNNKRMTLPCSVSPQ